VLVRLAELPAALTMSRQLEEQAAALFPVVTATGRDYRAWAKRIVWRDEQGDKDLLTIQVKFAREAMSRGAEQTT
jgi:hypothetical protein